jgi:hypothetical protein
VYGMSFSLMRVSYCSPEVLCYVGVW